jgi:methyltransferase
MVFFWSVILIVIIQRLVELKIAARNEVWLKQQGAIEYGHRHYKFIVLLHTCFFLSIIAEYYLRGRHTEIGFLSYLFFVIFIFLQAGRIWVLASLGKYWNTKILRIPGAELVSKGPYKYFKHPNYIVVVLELAVIPMMFNLYYTAIVFTMLNAVMLTVRIKEENRALGS